MGDINRILGEPAIDIGFPMVRKWKFLHNKLWVFYPPAKILLLFFNFKFVNNTAQLNIVRNKLNQKHILVIPE